MKSYKLKHTPTGLYYQPHKHRGSNLSKRGKIYQTKSHGLSSAFKSGAETFSLFCEKDSIIHKITSETLAWKECSYSYNQMKAESIVKDWIVESLDENQDKLSNLDKSQLKFETVDDRIDFYFNRILLGYAYIEVDGFYVFVFDRNNEGTWSDYSLRWIADKLTDLNKDWVAHLDKYFKEQDANRD